MNDNFYALKNAFIYTMLVAALLLVPTYLYVTYMKYVTEIQYEFKLKRQSHLIIRSMEEFDPKEKQNFEYPRFRSFQSGLYDIHFNPIFTLIKAPLEEQKVGYHIQNGYAYQVIALPDGRYFDASYLVVGGEISYARIYQDVVMILLATAALFFVLSLFFLDRFALPFQRLNKRLDQFIKDSMHEINTPLSIINVNIDLYHRSNPVNKYLQRIKAATKTLSTLYNDMDYLIKNERLSFEYETIDLSRFLRERCDYFHEVAALKNIVIDPSIEEKIEIVFNPTQLQRIIDNNLSNAIKYSNEEGKIEVILERNLEGCVLRFRDDGVGIEDVNRIFERYYRENQDKGGFGIGLNIVKSIIDKAGIELQIDSVYGEGSTFSYTFTPPIYISA
ncbi:MAG: HAMP domain-containing sensor histidine kinase [Sulfuricurvum sp.]|uniref:sensor histidine kinase n=1 Tax=Sulfuricurvum sp. TaxID=2025608 RepID=UPI00263A10E9|nr:HAMP domain-containing sensor histidine kinase [Sulfuricurvum sp.]MDD2829853.1 HAMP domain-containing sensor histidine kinase [Sulfuricurvum sp.]MDD4949093.1 HAMP domain-containing sensor histidine kinase [Sulfuricurvum sp.]